LRPSGIWYDLAGARYRGNVIVSEDGKHTICEPGIKLEFLAKMVDDLRIASMARRSTAMCSNPSKVGENFSRLR
jgi:hypothetical protein